MSALEQALTDYLQLRRSLGHELAEAGWLLPGFVAYLDAHGSPTVTIESALTWVQQTPTGQGTSVGARRMTAVRGFARYLAGIDAATEVPPTGLMPHRQRWRRPFIYSQADIDTVIERARSSIISPLRAATYATLIGLLAASGMRIGEAITLDRGDVNWAEGVLLIRGVEVRQVPAGAPARQQHGGAAELRRAARSTQATARRAELLHLPRPGNDCSTPWSRKPSGSSSTTPVSEPARPTLRVCTTCGTPSRSPPCSVGIARVWTCRPRSRRCRPTWGIASRAPLRTRDEIE